MVLLYTPDVRRDLMSAEHPDERAVHGVTVSYLHLVVGAGVVVLHLERVEPQSHLVILCHKLGLKQTN